MNKGKLLVISGPSGVGKTAVSHALRKRSDMYVKSVSATTRKMRPGEEHGVDYFFITPEEFEQLDSENKLLETTDYNGSKYGTPKQFIEDVLSKGKIAILVIDVAGALHVKEMFPTAITFFLNAESLGAIEKRLRDRKTDSEESIKGRLAVAAKELEASSLFDFVVMNKDGELEKTAETIDSMMKNIVKI